MNKFKCKVILTDVETGEEVVYELDSHSITLSNDLEKVPIFAGDMLGPPMYSRGFFVNLHGYINNKNAGKEYQEAVEESHRRVHGKS